MLAVSLNLLVTVLNRILKKTRHLGWVRRCPAVYPSKLTNNNIAIVKFTVDWKVDMMSILILSVEDTYAISLNNWLSLKTLIL